MSKISIGINGFGRIGRRLVRAMSESHSPYRVGLINDASKSTVLRHLLQYDSVHDHHRGEIKCTDNSLIVDGKEIAVSSHTDPLKIPWKNHDVDIVVECTGRFSKHKDAQKHLTNGARKVIISAPSNDADITLACGINLDSYNTDKHHIISNASCTTNCLAPIAKVLNDHFGIITGVMTTVHSYTNDQRILDSSHKDLRRGRTASMSMIPTTTGATSALALVLPELENKLDGLAIRVPTPNVSLIDLTARLEKPVTKQEVNQAFTDAAQGALKGILDISHEPLVSIDYNGNTHSAIVDAEFTTVVGDQVKVLAWYDNESGYSYRLLDLIEFIAPTL